ncbi:hypothetical protein LIP_0758 [Limnochorda pilosa]|uniref:Uncharacterized protein n=1 Tax=Limnochorda pilosa TaxID=1555112 RepID=A0A0K2SHQ0_LIMPI|nr:hypothetical protein LIP_0758 [Limnochorda pilosa]
MAPPPLHFNPADGFIYAVQPELGSLVATDPMTPRNDRFVPPVAQGLRMPACVRFGEEGSSMSTCSLADGVVWKVNDYL